MLENRPRGRALAKRTSYIYIILAVLAFIIMFAFNSSTSAMVLAERGASILTLVIGAIFYLIFAAAIYLISTRYDNDEMTWKLYVVIAVLNFIVIGFSFLILLLSVLLVVSANDIRNELI